MIRASGQAFLAELIGDGDEIARRLLFDLITAQRAEMRKHDLSRHSAHQRGDSAIQGVTGHQLR